MPSKIVAQVKLLIGVVTSDSTSEDTLQIEFCEVDDWRPVLTRAIKMLRRGRLEGALGESIYMESSGFAEKLNAINLLLRDLSKGQISLTEVSERPDISIRSSSLGMPFLPDDFDEMDDGYSSEKYKP